MRKLLFRYGTMGSSKSAHLLMTAYNFEEKGKTVLLIKSTVDTRDGNLISSRVPGLVKECHMIGPNESITNLVYPWEFIRSVEDKIELRHRLTSEIIEVNLKDLPSDPDGVSNGAVMESNTVILVDEAQFLTESQVEELAELADKGFFIICYGLRTAANTRMFEGSKRLFELADTLEELKSMCQCGHKTVFNARLNPDNITINPNPSNMVEVGGNDKYISVCRKCYRSKSKLMEEY